MANPTDSFFAELGRRGHEPALQNRAATVRFDVTHGNEVDRWNVQIDRGDITVSRGDDRADCVIGADQTLFDAIATGKANPMTAMLRGTLRVEGDAELLVTARRLLPAPPHRRPHDPPDGSEPLTTKARRRS
jgi:putative sterol carrier protein